jgi:FkbM family methyltransferase
MVALTSNLVSFAPVDRPSAFVLLSCAHGTLIVNKNDVQMISDNFGYGVGFELFQKGSFSAVEISNLIELLIGRKDCFGAGVVVLDCGANIGTHTLVWAKLMTNWGSVIAFEAQERIYYALAGNLAINNCFNASAQWCALGAHEGEINFVEPNPLVQSSFGSFELKGDEGDASQSLAGDYKSVPMKSIDSLGLSRVDLIKIDCEGMELDVLAGAKRTILRDHPILFIEILKCERLAVECFLEQAGYQFAQQGINLLAIHQDDPLVSRMKVDD